MAGFWIRWVAANAVGDVLGLGLVGLITVMLAQILSWSVTYVLSIVPLFAAMGALDGAVVGFAQWTVLRSRLHNMRARSWTMATAIGAAIAWFMGTLPATVPFSSEGPVTVDEPIGFGMVTVLAIEMGIGAAFGAVLAVPQWLILRRYVGRALWWIPANSLAWLVAMPMIFLAADASIPLEGIMFLLAVFAAIIAGAGALVGAIHGLVLIRLLMPAR